MPELVLLAALALLTTGALRAYRRRRWLQLAALTVATACAAAILTWRAPGWAALAAAGAVLLAGCWWWARRGRTSATVTRWGARSRRKVGVASTLDIARVASAPAMRRKATAVRPSTATLSRRERMRLPAADVGVELCRTSGLTLYASVEDVVAVFGGPRRGKTGWLAGRVIDAPGAALVTSTRTDLRDITGPLRAQRGPTRVFNAAGLAGLESTVTFDPLTGCADPTTAAARAADLLSPTSSGIGDREFWDGQARRVLAALLHAASLGAGLGMRDVLQWVADPVGSERDVTLLLRTSPEPAYVQDATQFLRTNDKTRSSITSTIMPALGWLTSPEARAAAEPGRSLDVAELLATRGTVYLLGAEESHTAPLVTAFTGHIAREARRIAATRPKGRLDPPLTLALDEAALICPVPLNRWSADMGGRGVTILACFQSRAQLLDRYGEAPAAEFLNNTGAVALFGGTRDRDDLDYWSSLAGHRDEPVITTDADGRVTSRSTRSVPVLSPAQLSNLPAGRVVVFRSGMPPAVGRARMAWHRKDVRAHAGAAVNDASPVSRRALLAAPAGGGLEPAPISPWGDDPEAPPITPPRWTPRTPDAAGRGGARRGRS